MKYACLAGLCALSLHCAALTGFDEDFDAALARAKTANTPMLVLFTGSDWCVWCKRLEAEVLSKPEFLDYATNAYELAVVDIPSDKSKQSAARQKRNSELLKKYGVRGFPTVLLVDGEGRRLHSAGYSEGGAKAWVESFRAGAAIAPLKAEHLGDLEKRMEALGKKFSEEMASAMQGAGEDKRKMVSLLKSTAAKYQPDFAALGKELKSKSVPDKLKEAKESLLGQFAQAIAMIEQYVKLDVDEFVAALEKAKESDKERRAPAVRHIALPRPADAKVGIDYFVSTAMPFYETRLVKTFVAPSGMKEAQAKAVLDVRRALARRLATGRGEFPTGDECDAARSLWNRKCRDAAVAVVHYLGMHSDTRYWKGASVFSEAAAVHDFAREPVLGFILRAHAFDHEVAKAKRDGKGGKAVDDAAVACEKAFEAAADAYKGVDGRVFSDLEALLKLPEKVIKAHGDRYVVLCKQAEDDMNRASKARGSGWARDVKEDGWKGWNKYNKLAESNLLEAVSLRPDGWQAPLLLSAIAGRAGVSQGDEFSWFSAAVSNSLDGCAEKTGRFLLFQTSRWGGSTDFLRGFLMDCATNVDVRSTFSYHGAAEALQTILVYEVDGMVQSNAFTRIVTPEVAAALYGMFDAYAAAPESQFMPDGDIFRGMGMSLALQLNDWKTVRRYWKSLKSPLRSFTDARWLKATNSAVLDGLRLRHQFEVLGRSKHAEEFIAAEEMFAAGRLDDALVAFDALQNIEKPFGAEKFLASARFFETRKVLQDGKGGWVDVMPSKFGGEANNIGGMTYTDADGMARCHGARRAYYRVHSPIPGIGVEIEGKVHFEKGDKPQSRWDIGWGLARCFSGRTALTDQWAFPYVAFSRDDKGDHYSVQTATRENHEKCREVLPAETRSRGLFMPLEVARGDLESKDSHAFSVKTTGGMLVVSVDGKEVYRYPLADMRPLEIFRYRIQPNGDVFPIWKVFEGTSFSGYRYRRVK